MLTIAHQTKNTRDKTSSPRGAEPSRCWLRPELIWNDGDLFSPTLALPGGRPISLDSRSGCLTTHVDAWGATRLAGRPVSPDLGAAVAGASPLDVPSQDDPRRFDRSNGV